MTFNISYSTIQTTIKDDSGFYISCTPCMEIDVNVNSKCTDGFYQDKLHSRTIRIFKNCPEDHHVRSPGTNCDSTIKILIFTPGNEWSKYSTELKKIVRGNTCDEVFSIPDNHSVRLRCSSNV